MIERMTDLPAHVVGLSAKGTVTTSDYEQVVIPAIEAMFAGHGKARFLYHLGPDFKGFEMGAMWDDAKLGLKHLTGWERVAVVTDVDWLRVAVRVLSVVMPGHTRAFHNSELADATRWVGE